MKEVTHPYSKYGLAVLMEYYELDSPEKITHVQLKEQLELNLERFRLKPVSMSGGKIQYEFIPYKDLKLKQNLVQSAGLANRGNYLSPNIITREKSAKQLFKAQQKLINEINKEAPFDKSTDITMSISPVTSKTNQGKSSQSNPKSSFFEAICCAITNTTVSKPSLSANLLPTGIIPDIPIENLCVFVRLFESMRKSQVGELMTSQLKNLNDEDSFVRPKLFHGNFPNAPYNYTLGPAALLGSLAEWSKEAKYNEEETREVLDALKDAPIYIVNYDKVQLVSFGHHVVELAKSYQLNKIIRGIEQTFMLSEERRSFKNPKYQTFFMMASRFLQLFNRPALMNFLSFRAIYHPDLKFLLNTYFMSKEKIPKDIVESARELGCWLNLTAYIAAKNENKSRNEHGDSAFFKAKSKALVELESTAFSAKSATALIAQTITRAGRLTGMDVPPEACRFMEATMSEEINITDAKNLLIAFSRLRNKKEQSTAENLAEAALEIESPAKEE